MANKEVIVTYHNMFGRESHKGFNGVRHYKLTIPSNGNITEDCETVFRYMNCVDDDPNGVEAQLLLFSDRSMSVGDSVTIDSRTFRCASFGWKEVTETTIIAIP